MKAKEYLEKILKSQTLAEDSDELKKLRERRDEVEKHLRDAFGSSPSIRYGGSQAKRTLVKDSYDLDLVCYFQRDDDTPGETLEEIYNKVKGELEKHYVVEPKTSALRIKNLANVDFHVDVVPGRFIEEDSDDVFLYRAIGDKCRLKTNIETHISHVRESGVTDAIKLMKIWRTRNGVPLKTFIVELITIEVLDGSTDEIDVQVRTVLEKLREKPEEITVKDPANPNGNDLSESWNDSVHGTTSAIARATLATIDSNGWEAVFGKLPEDEDKAAASTVSGLRAAAGAVSSPTRPWRRG
jgi:hypothetical protein